MIKMNKKKIPWFIVAVAILWFIFRHFISKFFSPSVENYILFPIFIIIEVILLILYFKKGSSEDNQYSE